MEALNSYYYLNFNEKILLCKTASSFTQEGKVSNQFDQECDCEKGTRNSVIINNNHNATNNCYGLKAKGVFPKIAITVLLLLPRQIMTKLMFVLT